MNYPKVSVLIPTYNRSKYLKECLDSVLSQDYPNFEVIVSDNASTDDTKQVIKKYSADGRVRYYRNEVNIGIVPNWKKLLYEYAAGVYGKLLCDDDYLLDEKHLKKCVDLILKEKLDIVLSGSLGRCENSAGPVKEINCDPDIPEVTDSGWWLENGGRKVDGVYLFLNFNDGAVLNIRKAKELNAFVPECFGLDYGIWLRFILSGRSGYLRGHHFVARTHPSNDGRLENFEKAFAGAGMFNRIYDFGLSLGLPAGKLSALRRRNIAVFANVFLVDKWFFLNGVSLKSIYDFYRRLKTLDKTVFFPVITDYATISTILRRKNAKLYEFLRRLIKK